MRYLTCLFLIFAASGAGLRAVYAAPPPPVLLRGHRRPVLFLAYPGGDLLISAAADGVRIWNPESGNCLKELQGGNIISAAYSGASGLLAVSRADDSITIYDSATWSETAVLSAPAGPALSLAFSGGGEFLAAASVDGRVRSWKTADWSTGPGLAASAGAFTLAGASGPGAMLATFSPDEPLLRLWDLRTQRMLYWLKSPHTLSVFFDPPGKRLAAALAGRTIRVWEPRGNSAPAPFEFEAGPLAAAAFSASGSLLAAAALDGSITVWDTDRGTRAADLHDSRARAVTLAFSPSGAYLAGGGADGDILVRLWADEVWTSTAAVPVKNPGGETLTLLPPGVRLELLKAPAGARHWLVSDGSGLSGWAPAAALGAERPDLSPPIIRITSQTYSGGLLTVNGLAEDDGRLDYLRFSGQPLERRAGSGKRTAPGDNWPFEISAALTPDIVPVLEAGDFSGKTASLALNLRENAAPYSPGYVLLEPDDGAAIFSGADERTPQLARAAPGAMLAALGKREGWYFLEGGGWLKAAAASERPQPRTADPASRLTPAPAAKPPAREPPPEEIPRGRANPRGLAVVIGVRDYTDGDIPRADYALEDAAAVKRHLVTALGFDEDKVLLLENPTKGQLETLFGGEGGGRLKGLIRKGETELFVYYSGHGAADPEAGAAYLVPSDARPDYLRLGGFPLKQLYLSLEHSGAAQVTVVIEACFSGLSHAGPLLRSASPLILAAHEPEKKGLNIFSSSGPDQVSSWYPGERRGLFTYYFLKALRENCCGGAPLRLGTLKDITGAEVPAAAMRLYGRTQTPLFTGDPQTALAK